MTRPGRLDILEYALEGASMRRGTFLPSTQPSNEDDEYLDQLDADIDWLTTEIARVKAQRIDEGEQP